VNVELICITILTVLLVVTNGFWAVVTFSLLNRLMSRDFFEFKQAKVYGKPKAVKNDATGDELVIDPLDEQQAQQMNSMMGMV
jgi:hypothetical protein